MPVPRDAASVAEGRRLARVYGCTGSCHGPHGEGTVFIDEQGGPGPGTSLGPLGRLGLVTGRFRTAAELIRSGSSPPGATTDGGARGCYLARTICVGCHGLDLSGGTTPAFVAPDLRVVAAYSPEQFAHLVRTGEALGGRQLGVMRLRGRSNLSHLTDAEMAALYQYLHGLTSN